MRLLPKSPGRCGAAILLFAFGLWQLGLAIAGLARTAVFVHEADVAKVVVNDVVQKPFESWEETLGAGNLSWPGDSSYRPIVRFTQPDLPSQLRRNLETDEVKLEADNVDYQRGQEVEVIYHPEDPTQAHLHRWKFQWGGSCIRLAVGALLLGAGWLFWKLRRARLPWILRPATRRSSSRRRGIASRTPTPAQVTEAMTTLAQAAEAAASPTKQGKTAKAGKTAAPRRRKTTTGTGSATEGSAPKKRTTRRKTAADGETAPRKRRSAKSRKKDDSQPELPLE